MVTAVSKIVFERILKSKHFGNNSVRNSFESMPKSKHVVDSSLKDSF